MKKLYYIIALFVCSSCGDGVNLPSPGVETDLYKLPVKEDLDKLMTIKLKDKSVPMIHCGALHTPEDFAYIRERLAEGKEPWTSGVVQLRTNSCARLDWTPNPQRILERFSNGGNYTIAMKDVAAAYQCALRYNLGDGEEYAQKSIEILRAWADKCTAIGGDSNSALAAGLYGYQFAVTGELMRDYWMEKEPDAFKRYQQWTVDVFYPVNYAIAIEYWGMPPFHYWANWHLCNLASMLATGILADRRDIYNQAVQQLQTGEGSGRMTHAIYHVYTAEEEGGKYAQYANLAQWQENGRDVGHTKLCQGLMGVICQLTWNQGDDFFGYNDNMYLKGCEYNGRMWTAKLEVPYIPYVRVYQGPWGIAEHISDILASKDDANGAGSIWALAYYHYAKIKGLPAEKYQYTKMGMEVSMPEGGPNGSGNSGAYDQLGFGTLMYAKE